ncbi:hypothetical protein BU15DRAFT_81816 [Melanogaster broomeanus]|nr:hypothetical protein BU15DRAFT_81816 [Melanogaster broomeanus]
MPRPSKRARAVVHNLGPYAKKRSISSFIGDEGNIPDETLAVIPSPSPTLTVSFRTIF